MQESPFAIGTLFSLNEINLRLILIFLKYKAIAKAKQAVHYIEVLLHG
jgi:hypothetical protein